MRPVIVVSVIVLASPFIAAEAEKKLTLPQAVALALGQSPQVKRGEEELWLARLEEPGLLALSDPVFSARAGIQGDRGPRSAPVIQGASSDAQILDLTVRQNWLTGTDAQISFKTQRLDNAAIFRPLNPTIDSSLSLNIRQPLLKNFWGRPDVAKRRQARSRVLAAEERLKRLKEEIAAQTTLSYVECLAANEAADIRNSALADAKRLYEKYQEKSRYGLIDASDLLQVRVSVRTHDMELKMAQSLAAQAQTALKTAIYNTNGAEFTGALEWPAPAPVTENEIENPNILQTAFAKRGDYQAARHELERASWFERVERLGTLPDLSAVASYASAGLDARTWRSWSDAASFEHQIMTAGLELQIPFGFKHEGLRRREAGLRLEMARSELRRLEKKIGKEIADARERRRLARTRLDDYRELLDLERSKLEAAEKDFRRGRADTDLLIRFQEDIHRTKALLSRARADEILTAFEVRLALGDLLEIFVL